MILNIKDFYLMTPMEKDKYTRLKLADLTEDVIKQYKLQERVTKYGYVNIEIRQKMYGLPQARMLAQK